jgi:hypothetical protein
MLHAQAKAVENLSLTQEMILDKLGSLEARVDETNQTMFEHVLRRDVAVEGTDPDKQMTLVGYQQIRQTQLA